MTNSLSARLTYRIMAVVLVMMVVIAGVVNYTVWKYMLDEAQDRYLGFLLENHQEIRRKLSDVHVAADNNVHDIERDIDDPDKMFGHMERIVRQNPSIVCSALLFQQDFYSSKGRVFVPCARKDKAANIVVSRIDSTYHSYFYGEWFQEQMKADQSTWTKPYFESRFFAGDQEPRLLTTYIIPIHDHEGHPVALLAADLSLEWLRNELQDDINEINSQYEKGYHYKSYFFIIDRDGTYVIHPNQKLMLTHFDDKIGKEMLAHRGTCVMEIDGVKSRLYYRSFKYVDWTMVIVVPEEAIMANAKLLNIILLAVMISGLLAIYLFCRHQIRKTTTPLKHFADTVDQMAMGNFSTSLPEIKSGDEVRQLHDAFANMQTSLTIYVDELQKTSTQKASLERELKIAQGIQMSMLPKAFPSSSEPKGIDLYASLTPARDVGGDLYDYFLRDNRLFFCIGDVTGKGVPAALLMAVMRAMFRSEARRANCAAAIVEAMNKNLCEESSSDYFVTMFVGILDLQTGRLDYCNAGHEAPFVTGQPLPIKHNLPVGALSDWTYEGQKAQLKRGDMLFLYTDGLTEAKNTEKKSMSRNRVAQLAQEYTNDTARQLVERMEAEAHRYAGEAEQSDDITLFAIRWNGTDGEDLLKMKASMEEIGRLEPFVADVARRADISEKEAKRLRLAVEEAVANIINYGEATVITLHATVEGGQLALTIDDDGQPFDPTKGSATDLSVPADQRPPGGLGIIMLHQMTDGLTYQRADGHNILTLRKNCKL